MIEFAWPYVFLLVPLPWLVYHFIPASHFNESASLNVPGLDDYANFQQHSINSSFSFKTLFVFIIWLFLLLSASRPQQIGEIVELPQSGRDLMLAVDLSGSMQTPDFEINKKFTDRLTALKLIAGEFLEKRKGDRVGLILFGSHAYIQTPLTFDIDTVKQLLMEASVGLAGNETAIGDAIGLSIKQLRDSPQNSRVLILMTDGVNNVGDLSPEKAAELAAHEKIKIHTLAIGADQMVVQTLFGAKKVNPSIDLDEKTLKTIADKTGGKYFRAYNTKELVQIYDYLDQLESIERSSLHYRTTEELYYWPLYMALFGLAAFLFFSGLRKRGYV